MPVKSPRKAKAVTRSASPPDTSEQTAGPSLVERCERHAKWIAILLVLIGTVRIYATYDVFSHTSDEPNHIACGMEFLDKGTYTYETQHPPLARVAAAIGPYLLGARSQGRWILHDSMEVPNEGLRILNHEGKYERNLRASRLGILPFYWVACWAVFGLGFETAGVWCGLVALLLFSFEPSVLAHSGLSTTDMAITAFAGASCLALIRWLRAPSAAGAAFFGASLGLCVLSKLSSLPFLASIWGVMAVWYLAQQRPPVVEVIRLLRERIPTACIAGVVLFVVIWAGFRFSFGNPGHWPIRVPFPEFFSGIQAVREHNQIGHFSYLLGKLSKNGFWYFFPVVLSVKLPLALLVLLPLALYLVRGTEASARLWIPLAMVAGTLLVAVVGRISIGVRHVLPMYFGLSILGALAYEQFRRPSPVLLRAALVVLLLSYCGASLMAHPDYLPFFNVIAGDKPERITVDSNLDWGQDMKRLSKRLKELNVKELGFDQYYVVDYAQLGFPPVHETASRSHVSGWNAASLTHLMVLDLGINPSDPFWPGMYKPVERVGKGIFLYNIPEPKRPPTDVKPPNR